MVFLSPPNSNGLLLSIFQARTNPPLTRALAGWPLVCLRVLFSWFVPVLFMYNLNLNLPYKLVLPPQNRISTHVLSEI